MKNWRSGLLEPAREVQQKIRVAVFTLVGRTFMTLRLRVLSFFFKK